VLWSERGSWKTLGFMRSMIVSRTLHHSVTLLRVGLAVHTLKPPALRGTTLAPLVPVSPLHLALSPVLDNNPNLGAKRKTEDRSL
jgi:hypothetical protein